VAAAGDFPGYLLGSDSAPVEVVEYADFQCPACAQFAILTMHDVQERLIQAGRVRWRFRDFPLEDHDKSRLAHHAAACAGEQNQFWAMHDQIYYGQSRWYSTRPSAAARTFRDYGRAIGLDLDAYDACMETGRYQARIEASVQEGIGIGVNSTPTFVIGGAKVPGSLPYDGLRRMIDSIAALKR
jgi:protein-disulfide isomerase